MPQKKNTDSLSYYLEKREQQLNSPESKRFYYLQKADFFKFNNQFDSARIYLQTVLKMNQNELKNESTTPENTYVVDCYLLKISIQKGEKSEADSIISKLSEMEQDTIRFIFLKIC